MNLKLTVEIKDDHFIFDYQVGSSRHGGSQPVSVEGFFLFNDILTHLHKNVSLKEGKRDEAFSAYCFTQAYPELMKEIEKKFKKK